MRTPLALSVEPRFHDELIELPRDAQKKVTRALHELQAEPARLSKPLQGAEGIWRREIAPYRILFAMGDGWIHVYSVQHRHGVYTRLATPKALPDTAYQAFPDLTDEQLIPEEEASPSPGKPFDAGQSALPTELVSRIAECRTPDDLLSLLDLGLPEELFDELLAQLSANPETSRRSPAVHVTLIKQKVIESFFAKLLTLPDVPGVREVTVVSPWITPWKGPGSSLDAVVALLTKRRIRASVVTRPPVMPEHKAAMVKLATVPSCEIVELPGLHAKYFTCDTPPVPFALLASANATHRSLSNFEIGVLVRGSGMAETFVRDLEGLTIELRTIGKRVKKRGLTQP